jgi:hypothetical protein
MNEDNNYLYENDLNAELIVLSHVYIIAEPLI